MATNINLDFLRDSLRYPKEDTREINYPRRQFSGEEYNKIVALLEDMSNGNAIYIGSQKLQDIVRSKQNKIDEDNPLPFTFVSGWPEIPSSLPANGGNANTVGGKYPSDFASADTALTRLEQLLTMAEKSIVRSNIDAQEDMGLVISNGMLCIQYEQ